MKYLCLASGAEKDWKALTWQEQDALLPQDEVVRKRGSAHGGSRGDSDDRARGPRARSKSGRS
jgi:hypothetical protein